MTGPVRLYVKPVFEVKHQRLQAGARIQTSTLGH